MSGAYGSVDSTDETTSPADGRKRCCSSKCCAWACLVVSVLLVVLGGLAYVLINPLVVSVMTTEFVINSPDAVRYADWACKFSTLHTGDCATEHDSVPFFESYFMFNLTNYDDVLTGAVPSFVELGPYAYQVSITKFNVTFNDNGNTVSYIECWTYFWRPDMSCEGCTEDDLITGINTGYLGAVGTAGSETLLVLGMTGPAIDVIIDQTITLYFPYLNSEGYTNDDILTRCSEYAEVTCTSLQQAALVQWYYWDRPRLSQVCGLFPEVAQSMSDVPILQPYFPTAPEYGCSRTNTTLSLEAAEMMLYGPHGITHDPLNLLDMLSLANNETALEEKYGITPRQFLAFSKYFIDSLAKQYNAPLIESKISPIRGGGGLFSQRTLYEWIFDFEDPLALILQPGDPQTGIRHNDTSFEDAASYKVGLTIFTGQDDINEIGNVVKWNGTEIITFWQEPIPVQGNNQDGQFIFQPLSNTGKYQDVYDPFPIFSPDHARTVYLNDTGIWVYTPMGIPTRRFVLDNNTYAINPFYSQNITGFCDGSKYHSDPPFRQRFVFTAQIPLWLSQPRFYQANETYASKIELNKYCVEPGECDTIVDVEPVSGNAMFALKRLQVNFYISEDIMFDVFYPNVTKDVFMPSLWVQQSSAATPELEDEWLSELGLGTTIEKALFIGGMAAGALFLVLSIVALMHIRRKENAQTTGYDSIN